MPNATHKLILDTFGRQLERMPFEKITVSGLIKECAISRNTFYYHFEDIYDLLDTGLAQNSFILACYAHLLSGLHGDDDVAV